MKAVRLQQQGLANNLRLDSVPKPEITDKQILVKVFVTSVNQIDWKMGSGMIPSLKSSDYPWIPGMDFAGQVERVGDSVKSFKKGDFVVGCGNGGSYAEYIAADPRKTVLKPDTVSFIEGVAAAYVAQTAWQALVKHGKITKGDKVLVQGAAGAVGAFTVQFAHLKGAYIYATGSGSDRDYVMSLGADRYIDYSTEDFSAIAKNVDLVIDMVGGSTLEKSYPQLRSGGRLVTLTSGINEKLAEKYNVNAIGMSVKPTATDLKRILKYMSEGKVVVDIAAVFWLNNAHEAWEYVLNKDASKKVHGKVMIQVK